MKAVHPLHVASQPSSERRPLHRSSPTLWRISVSAALLWILGCGSGDPAGAEPSPAGPWPTTAAETPAAAAETATPTDPRIADAERLGALAVRIEFDPARSETLLQAEGLDRAAFESKLYDFALDADLANAYERGRMDTRRALKAAAAP